MAHDQQQRFFSNICLLHGQLINNSSRILEVGSQNINGTVRDFFPRATEYLGVDLGLEQDVDWAVPGEILELPNGWADIVISTECFEHCEAWPEVFLNMLRILKAGGLFISTCATHGRPTHGTIDSTTGDSPFTPLYYKNLEISDISSKIDLESYFISHTFEVNTITHDLYFSGIRSYESIKTFDDHHIEPLSRLARAQGQLAMAAARHSVLQKELDRYQEIAEKASLEAEQARKDAERALAEKELIENLLIVKGTAGFRKSLLIAKSNVKSIVQLFNRKLFNRTSRYLLRGDLHGLMRRSINYLTDSRRNAKTLKPAKNVCIIYTRHTSFVAFALSKCLRSFGLAVAAMNEVRSSGDFYDYYIVICPQMHNKLPRPEKTICFQLEQANERRWFTKKYINILENSLAVLEYTQANIQHLDLRGLSYPHIFLQPILPVTQYTCNINSGPANRTDVPIFYGSFKSSKRRQILLERLEKFGHIDILDNAFAEDLKYQLSSHKVVINLHYYSENSFLETTRVAEAISSGCLVLSENSVDADKADSYYGSLFKTLDFTQDIDQLRHDYTSAIASIAENYFSLQDEVVNICRSGEALMKFFLARALVGIGIAEPSLVLGQDFPHLDLQNWIVLSLPETFERRCLFDGSPLKNFSVFDGIRHSLGWVGCGLSYKYLAQLALRKGLSKLYIMEDDALIDEYFCSNLQIIEEFLDTLDNSWDMFSGVMAKLPPNVHIYSTHIYKNTRFIVINRVLSMVCNIYNKRLLDILASWNHEDLDAETNTIDQYINKHDNLKIVVAIPFTVGHRETCTSTLWGFSNDTYAPMISQTEAELSRLFCSYHNFEGSSYSNERVC